MTKTFQAKMNLGFAKKPDFFMLCAYAFALRRIRHLALLGRQDGERAKRVISRKMRLTAEKILVRGGDYLLTLKGDHKLAHAAVVEHFDQHCFRVGAPSPADCDAVDDTHGRLVRCRVFANTEAAALNALSGWPGLCTVLAIESIRSVNSAPTTVEAGIRYFLSSCPDDPAVPREPEGFAAGPGHTPSASSCAGLQFQVEENTGGRS